MLGIAGWRRKLAAMCFPGLVDTPKDRRAESKLKGVAQLNRDGGLPLVAKRRNLAQSKEELLLISELALLSFCAHFCPAAPEGGGRAVATSRGWRQALSEAAEGWGRRFLGRF